MLPGPRVAPRALPRGGVQVDERLGTGALAQGLGQLSQGVGALADVEVKARAEADAWREDQLDLEGAHFINQRMRGEKGFLNQLGENALDPDAPLADIKKGLEAIHGKAVGEGMQRRLGMRFARRMEDAEVGARQHSAGQYRGLQGDISEGAKKAALEAAGLANGDPLAVRSAVQQALVGPEGTPGPVRRFLMGQGLPSEAVAAHEKEFEADAWGAALNQQLAKKDWEAAQALLDHARGRLGAREPEFEARVAEVGKAQRAERFAEGLAGKYVSPDTGLVDVEKARADLASAPEDLRDEVAKRLEAQIAKREDTYGARVTSLHKRILSDFLTSGAQGRRVLPGAEDPDAVWLARFAPDEWRKLELIKNQDDAEGRARAGGRSTEPSPQQVAAMGAFRLWAADNPDLAGTMPIDVFNQAWAHHLTPKQREDAQKVLAQAHEAANNPGARAVEVDKALLELGGSGPGGAGIFPSETRDRSKWTADQLADFAWHASTLQEAADAIRKGTGKPPTREELRKLAAPLFTKGGVPGTKKHFWGKAPEETTLGQAKRKGTGFEVDAKAIPAPERKNIEAALQKQGEPVTEEAVARMYAAKHRLQVPPPSAKAPPAPKPQPPGELVGPPKPPEPPSAVREAVDKAASKVKRGVLSIPLVQLLRGEIPFDDPAPAPGKSKDSTP